MLEFVERGKDTDNWVELFVLIVKLGFLLDSNEALCPKCYKNQEFLANLSKISAILKTGILIFLRKTKLVQQFETMISKLRVISLFLGFMEVLTARRNQRLNYQLHTRTIESQRPLTCIKKASKSIFTSEHFFFWSLKWLRTAVNYLVHLQKAYKGHGSFSITAKVYVLEKVRNYQFN